MLRRLLLLGLGGLAACARVDLPEVAIPGSGNEGMAAVVEDRVWIDTGADAPAGALRAFLSDGTLIMTSCVETYRLAPWRWVEGAMLVWEEDGRSIRAEVALAERNEMVLVVDLGEESVTRHFRRAELPVVCPDLPR